jgi:hypothetical protein
LSGVEQDYDYVYHLAAEFGRINGEEYYDTLWQTNVIGTRNILEWQKQSRALEALAAVRDVHINLTAGPNGHIDPEELRAERVSASLFPLLGVQPAVFHMNDRTPRKGYGNMSKAADITQDIMEKDFGLSNFKDNMREGDQAIITPPHLQPAVQNFFTANGPIIAAAKQGAAAARAEGSNPMTIIQKAAKMRGTDRVPISVVARK